MVLVVLGLSDVDRVVISLRMSAKWALLEHTLDLNLRKFENCYFHRVYLWF